MNLPPRPIGAVVDNMILARFVDSGRAPLLGQLASGRIILTPSVFDPSELPPYLAAPPISEFAKGIEYSDLPKNANSSRHRNRVHRRTAFIQTPIADRLWLTVELTPDILKQAQLLRSGPALEAAIAHDPAFPDKIVDFGEAECAAVAITHNVPLFTDDRAIIGVLAALYPTQPIERTVDLIVRAVDTDLIHCNDAVYLHNSVFIDQLNLLAPRVASNHGAIEIIR